MARRLALAVALVAALVPVSGAGGAHAQTPKRGGTVVIADAALLEPACLNAFVAACSPTLATVDAFSEVFEGAFEITPDGAFRPRLVSAVEIVSEQPLTLLYRIRPEARWSDGVAISAKDFVFTYQALRKLAPTADESVHVRSVRTLDRKTVRVVLRTRYADWRYLFGTVLPRHVLAGQDLAKVWRDGIENPRTGEPIGSGPFLVGGWDRGRQLTFVRNSRYWGAHVAYLDRLVYRFLPPQETAAALRRGDADMIRPGPAVLEAQHQELRRQPEPGIRVLSFPVGGFEHFTIRVGDGGHSALANRLVRQALAYGIDRVAIARAIGEQSFAPASTIGPQDSMVFPRTSRYYRANWSTYRHRMARARQLLEQAGCQRGVDGIYVCDGDRLSLRFATVAGVARRELTVRLAQEQLGRVGIEVTLEFAPPAVFFPTIERGNFDVASFAWFMDARTSGPGDALACQRANNWSGYCDRLVTRDVLRATRTLGISRRVGLLNRIDARLARAVPHIPLFQHSGLFAFNAAIRGVVPGAWNAEDWWLDD